MLGCVQGALSRYGLVTTNVAVTKTSAQSTVDGQCQTKWHSFCLDGTGLSVAGVNGIIAGGVIFIVICIIAAICCVRRYRNHRRHYYY